MTMSRDSRLASARLCGPVCVDIAGTTVTPAERERLLHPLVGMVILFSRNYENCAQLAQLTGVIHELRPGLVIAVDHEGGRVQRFREGFTSVPAMRELSCRTDAVEALHAAGLVLAAELRACGVDFTFAPVLDVDYGRSGVIGDRSLGDSPAAVVRHARALIEGLKEGGMSSCGKHFPGHGWPEGDSHTMLPRDERDRAAVLADAAPYGELAAELGSLMTAHVAYDAFGGEVATYSRELLKSVLRESLACDALVFSDDLTMKGAGGEPIETRAQRALSAGCDMLLVCNAPEEADRLLSKLSWVRTPEFERRFERLLPNALTAQAQRLDAARRLISV